MEQITLFDLTKKPFKIDKPIRLITLFSGYDSQAMALKRLGVNFEHYRAIEFDKYAVASLNAVHGTNFEPTNICDVHADDLEITDKDKYTYFLTYSYPCTSLSLAGKQEGMDRESGTASSLLWEVERILKECKELGTLPDVLQMENVTECHNYKNIDNFREWTDFLESLGYTNYLADMNAADYLVAQHRERSIMISILAKHYQFKTKDKLGDTEIKTYMSEAKAKASFLNSWWNSKKEDFENGTYKVVKVLQILQADKENE